MNAITFARAEASRYVPAEQDGAIQSGMNAGGFWYPGEAPKTFSELIAECECNTIPHSTIIICNTMTPLNVVSIRMWPLKAHVLK